jgi:hypothetical protein
LNIGSVADPGGEIMFELMLIPSLRSSSARAAMICRRTTTDPAKDCRRRSGLGTCYRQIRAKTALLTSFGKKSNLVGAIDCIPLRKDKAASVPIRADCR